MAMTIVRCQNEVKTIFRNSQSVWTNLFVEQEIHYSLRSTLALISFLSLRNLFHMLIFISKSHLAVQKSISIQLPSTYWGQYRAYTFNSFSEKRAFRLLTSAILWRLAVPTIVLLPVCELYLMTSIKSFCISTKSRHCNQYCKGHRLIAQVNSH